MTVDAGAEAIASDAAPPPPASRIPLSPSVWFAVIGVGLAGVVPAALMASTPIDGHESTAWIWALLLVVVAGTRYAWLVAQGSARLFEIVFWLFTYVFLGLAPMSQMRSDRYPQTTPQVDTSLNATAMGVVWIGVAAFLIGVSIATIRPARPASRQRVSLVVPHRLYIFCLLTLVVCGYYIAKISPKSLVLSRVGRSAIESASWSNSTVEAVIKAFVTLAPVIAFAAVLRLRRQRRAVGEHYPVVWAWVMLVLVVLIDNPVSTPRYVTGTALLGVAVALGAASRAGRLRILAVSLVLGLVIVFPLLDLFRYSTDPGQTSPQSFSETLVTADFDAIDQINNTVSFVQVNGSTGGKQLLGAVFFFVPRTVWSSKADDTGVLLASYRGYKVTNLSAPVWTELFIDFAWVGLGVGMLLLGYVLRRWDDAALASFRIFPAPGVLSGTLPFYLVIMLRGSLLQSMAGFTVLIVCAALVGRRVPASRVAAELSRS